VRVYASDVQSGFTIQSSASVDAALGLGAKIFEIAGLDADFVPQRFLKSIKSLRRRKWRRAITNTRQNRPTAERTVPSPRGQLHRKFDDPYADLVYGKKEKL
jgi:hypothetical protein